MIRLGLKVDHAIFNSAMMHALVLNAKVRRNERLRQTLDNDNMLGPAFDFKIS